MARTWVQLLMVKMPVIPSYGGHSVDSIDFYMLTAQQADHGGGLVEVREETVQSPFCSSHFVLGKPYLAKEPIGIDASEVRGLDFAANYCLVPFISVRLARVFEPFADDVQLIDTTDPEFKILNVLHELECLHYEKSRFWPFEATHPKSGKPMLMMDLCIQRESVGDAQVFRVCDWPMPIIIGPAVAPGIRALNSETAGATSHPDGIASKQFK